MEIIEVTVGDLVALKPQIILNDPAFQGRAWTTQREQPTFSIWYPRIPSTALKISR